MITAPNCKVRSIENTTKMLLIVFFLKVWFYKLNTDFTSSHSENKLTVYHDLKRLLVDVHWVFLRLVQRNPQRLEGQSGRRVPVRLGPGASWRRNSSRAFLPPHLRPLPAPQRHLCAGGAGYNCLLALSGPFWLQDLGGWFI